MNNVYLSWHFQNVIHNLYTRFLQSIDQKSLKWYKQKLSINSNSTIVQGLKNKLMLKTLDISEICSMIQRFNSYNLLADKVAEKVPWTLYRPDKKSEKSIGVL